MPTIRPTAFLPAIALLALSVGAIAAPTRLQREFAAERHSPDLVRAPAPAGLARSRGQATTPSAFAVTDADVGDSDSFGRTVNWLGLASAFITLDASCPPPSSPDEHCTALAPAPGPTSFHFDDAARITLPAKATHSLLCYWFSPVLAVDYANPTGADAIANLRYTPTLTVENPVLATPGLVDPTTGAPFGGSLLTSMTSSQSLSTPLAPGMQFTQRTRESSVCMAGLLSRRALVETYGLSNAQADEFFRQPTTIRLNVAGRVQYVAFASLTFGLRIVGD